MGIKWRSEVVADLQANGVLLVEDGNHGEYRPRRNEFVDSGVAFIRAADLDNGRVLFESASKINEVARLRITKGIGAPGDVLLSHKGTVGKTALVSEDAPAFVCSPQTTFWRTLDSDVLDRQYLFAYLRSPEFREQLRSRSGETDMAPYVSLTSQRGFSVLLPPIEEQRAIAHILGTLDDKIELNRRMNETVEAMTRALFKSWFVDFDPVRAKMEGRWRPGQSLPGLPADLYGLFPNRLVPSEIGEIPEGWGVKAVGDLCHLARDGINPSESPDEIFDHYSIPAFDDGRVPKPDPGSAIKSNKYVVAAGCVLLSKLNPRIPRVWLPVLSEPRRSICSTEFLVALPNPGWTTAFLYCLFKSKSFESEFASLVTGTSGSHQRVRPKAFLQLMTAAPPEAVVAGFGRLASDLIARVADARNESRTLAALRETLLPKLISGVVRVNPAQPQELGAGR